MKHHITPALSALMLVGAFASSAGAELKGKYEISAQAGAMRFEGDANMETSVAYGGRLGHFFTERVSAEISGFGGAAEKEGSGADVPYMFPAAAASYHFRFGKFMPFVQAGAGVLRFNPEGGSAFTDLALHWGGGLKYFYKPALLLRADLSHVMDTDNGSGTHNFMGVLGVSWLFETSEEAPKKAKPAAPPDSDKDGVADAKDYCAGTPAGTKVDAQGCPAPADEDSDGIIDDRDKCPGTAAGAEVDAEGCQLPPDTDSDGVRNDKDKCPGTAAGVKVDAAGCPVPVDTDADGVIDEKDECANTPAGTIVDAKGCPQVVKVPEDKWVLTDFARNSDVIRPQSRKILNGVAATLKARPRSSICLEIAGHTDTTGGKRYNLKLSKWRAMEVRAYLARKGVAAAGMEAAGYGGAMPIADNATKAGRQANRRVELTGCPEVAAVSEGKWVLSTFTMNSEAVRLRGQRVLAEVVARLRSNPSLRLQIDGYTDISGSKKYNLKLSKWRAEVVKKYMVRKGIAAKRLTIKGYGVAKPIADNATYAGRMANRRVELTVVGK